MARYTTGQAQRLLGLPASTLRYWQREFALIDPRRDAFGRRSYSTADLCTLLRLRHLALRRGLGLSAARRELLARLGSPRAEVGARVAQLRGELVDLYFESTEAAKRLGGGQPTEPAGEDGAS